MATLPARLRHALPYTVLLAASVALYASALQIDTSGTAGGQRMGPDFWPKLVLALMAALCVFEIGKRLFMGGAESERKGAEPPHAPPIPHRAGEDPAAIAAPQVDPAAGGAAGRHPLAWGLALIAGFVVLVPWIGFFIATLLFLGAFTWIGGYRRRPVVALTAVFGSLLMVVVFMRLAYVSLPLGAGPFRELSLALLHLLGVR